MRASETEQQRQQKLQTEAKWRQERKREGSRKRERGKCAKMFQFKLIIVCATSGAAKKRQAEA